MATNYTLDELADLEAAMATGVLRVTHQGVTTEYRTRADMMAQVRLMRQELGLSVDDIRTPAIRRLRFLGTKGF